MVLLFTLIILALAIFVIGLYITPEIFPGKTRIIQWEDGKYSVQKIVLGFRTMYYSGNFWHTSKDGVRDFCMFSSLDYARTLKINLDLQKIKPKAPTYTVIE